MVFQLDILFSRVVQQHTLAHNTHQLGPTGKWQAPRAHADGGAPRHRPVHQHLFFLLIGDAQHQVLRVYQDRRHFDAQPARNRRNRPALQHQRHQHHEESQLEKYVGMLQPRQRRKQCENDRHRAAQAAPADEHLLAPGEMEGKQGHRNSQRARHEYQRKGDPQSRKYQRHQAARGHQQAQHQKHADLCQPGNAVVEATNILGVRQ